MTDIKSIITLLDNELHRLIDPYQKRINDIDLEKKRLQEEIDFLSIKNNELQKQLLKIDNNNYHEVINNTLLTHIKQLSPHVSEKIIVERCVSSSEGAYLVNFYLNNYLEQGQIKKVYCILDLLAHTPNSFLHSDQAIQSFLGDIFEELILRSNQDNEYTEETVIGLINFISAVYDTSFKTSIVYYVQRNFAELMDSVLFLNEPKIIISLLRVLMKYELDDELKEALLSIVKFEWSFLDANISQEEFEFFLWYAYLFDLDQQLKASAEACLKWLDKREGTFSIYTFLCDGSEMPELQNTKYFNQLVEEFKGNSIFNEQETERLLKKMMPMLKLFIEKNPIKPIYMEKIFMLDKVKLEKFIIDFKLQKQEMRIPLYKNKRSNLPSRFVNLNIYTTKNMKKAFLSFEAVNMINQKYHSEFLQVIEYEKVNALAPLQEEVQLIEDSFQWPSINVQENLITPSQDQPTLKESSELKELGYQITGLTRTKRWSILQKAVPIVGLKKTAYIIASNIRLRKGQKNGLEKFQYAIGEWEYDLDKLKKTYYKNNFIWPRF